MVTGYLDGNLSHAWNKVKIDDEWQIVDVTNNDNEYFFNALLNLPSSVGDRVLVEDKEYMLDKVIYGLGIENIGVANAKVLCRHFQYDLKALCNAGVEELSAIDGVGEVIAAGIYAFFRSEERMEQLNHLLQEITIAEEVTEEGSQTLAGMNFVITGSLEHYENRNALRDEIEAKGGKVTRN